MAEQFLQLADAAEKADDAGRYEILRDAFVLVNGASAPWREFLCTVNNGGHTSAALTLAPRDWRVVIEGCNDSWHVAMNDTRFFRRGESTGFAAFPDMAIAAAALRAHHAMVPA